jgi:type IV pilus assembly protein PilV
MHLVNTNRRSHARPNHLLGRSRSRGVTLVEILVTVVITSVGLLGVAALQLSTLRNNFDSTIRTQASVFAADIVDRMRANRIAALAGQYNIAITAAAPTTPANRAQFDLFEWKAAVAGQLPSGRGSIAFDAATNVATVVIDWSERGAEGATTASTIAFTSTTQL